MPAWVHGKNTVVKLDANDISAFTNSTDIKRSADTHDTTPYGSNSHIYAGGLKDATVTVGGTFDSTATTGPGESVEPLLGTEVTFLYQALGTGSAKPQRSMSVIVSSYQQTAPSDDMVTWSADLQVTGDVDETPQT